jgi:polar amino acid transport system substrate-binding protein
MIGLTACSGGGFLTRARPPLRVGVSPDYPPVVFEQQGEIVGIEADLARSVGTSLGRRIEFARYPFPELLGALERGEIDVIMSGLSITPERAARVRFTEPYMELGQLALIRSRDLARFGRVNTIRRAGARVGYQRGTTGERFVAEGLPRSTSFAFESVEEGLRNLRAGRIDFFVHDAPTIWRIAGDVSQRDLHGLYKPLTQEQIAWAVRAGNDALREQLDEAITQWKKEGLIEPVVQRWIPVRVTLR